MLALSTFGSIFFRSVTNGLVVVSGVMVVFQIPFSNVRCFKQHAGWMKEKEQVKIRRERKHIGGDWSNTCEA